MSSFAATLDEFKINYYPIGTLPYFMRDSVYFTNWQEVCPDETVFPISTKIDIKELKIETKDDFNKLIEAEAQLIFTDEVHFQILRNVDNFWRTNPNSSGLKLPPQGMSWLGDQINALFTNKGGYMVMLECMKKNYVKLFEYIYHRDGPSAFRSSGPFEPWSLLYYAVSNNSIDVLKRAIELNYPLKSDTIEKVIEKNNIDIAKVLINTFKEKGKELRIDVFYEAFKKASPEMLNLLLDAYVPDINHFCYVKNDKYILKYAIYNIANFKILLERGLIIEYPRDYETIELLFYECLSKSLPLERVLFIEQYFGVKISDFRKDSSKNKSGCEYMYINVEIIEKDNIDLYRYLRSQGFYVLELAESIVTYKNCLNITPGLVRAHYEQDKQLRNLKL
jgi:hypothetical protein